MYHLACLLVDKVVGILVAYGNIKYGNVLAVPNKLWGKQSIHWKVSLFKAMMSIHHYLKNYNHAIIIIDIDN